jgi:4-hydroxy-tetrahydrodipicolinate reductase
MEARMKTMIAVNGACGRMGQRIIQLAHADADLKIAAALDDAAHAAQGRDVGELAGIGRLDLPVAAQLAPHHRIDAVIDFSTPEGTLSLLPTCVDRKIPIVVATTGFTDAQRQQVEAAGHHTALLFTPNLSLVVNVLFKLVREAATALRDQGFDIEIIERHHRYKKDSPSGTAIHFARIREGLVGERPAKEIGMHAVRVGDNVGEHTIIFSTLGETMELVHKGHTRDAYVFGALQAAKWLANRPAGRYTMADVLGL